MESAIGYEGPVSLGAFATAVALIVGTVVVVWLLVRWLTGRFSRR